MSALKKIRILRKPGSERGQNLVEFAIILPIFVILLMGIIDFGYMLKMQTDLARANADGARAAAFSATDTEVQEAIKDALPGSFDTSRLTIGVTRETTPSLRGTKVKVDSKYLYENITPLPFVGAILQDKPLGASTTVRVE
jgi:Flp pilus assembly protein TadG